MSTYLPYLTVNSMTVCYWFLFLTKFLCGIKTLLLTWMCDYFLGDSHGQWAGDRRLNRKGKGKVGCKIRDQSTAGTSWFEMPFSHKRNQGSSEKLLILRPGREINLMSLGNPIMPEIKEILLKNQNPSGGLYQKTEGPTERAPSGQHWFIFSKNKTNFQPKVWNQYPWVHTDKPAGAKTLHLLQNSFLSCIKNAVFMCVQEFCKKGIPTDLDIIWENARSLWQ